MRQMFLALAVAAVGGFMTASCGNSSNKGDMGSGDMAVTAPPDMAVAKANCLGISQCVYTCITGGTDVNTCIMQCSKNTKAGSFTKWENAVLCGQSYCVGDADMMTGKCIQVQVPNQPAGTFDLCDPGTTYAQCSATTYMSTSCLPCLDQARNFWIYDISVDPMNPGPPTGMCSMPTSADCMGAKALCGTQFNACLYDT
jgi:hypothetical protein